MKQPYMFVYLKNGYLMMKTNELVFRGN